MNEKKVYFIVAIMCLVLFIIAGTGLSIQTNRLEQTRRQLDHTRIELESATDRLSDAREVLERDGRILSESFTTIEGIREQIKIIRISYEEMESLLIGDDRSSCDVSDGYVVQEVKK